MIDNFSTDCIVRNPIMRDLQAVYRLHEACDIAEYGTPDITLDDLRSAWQAPTFHLETDAWMVVGPGDQLVGYAEVMQRQHVRTYAFLRVLPEFAGKGIEKRLLNLVEEWARRDISLARPDARVALCSWESSVNTIARQALLQAGFQEVRRSWRMEIGMSQVPVSPEWPGQITIRTFNKEQDSRAVYAAIDETFQDHWGHIEGEFDEWKHWAIDREFFDPTLWFIAFDGDEIAGLSLCSFQENTAWVDTLGVRRPWRRKGLGMALLQHSFGEFYRRGQKNVVLTVDSQNLTGATRLYERAGMHVARTYITYEKELRAGIELSTQAIPIS